MAPINTPAKKSKQAQIQSSDLSHNASGSGSGGGGAGGSGNGSGAAAVDLSKVRAYAACRSCRQKKVRCLPSNTGTGSGKSGGDQPGPCQQCIAGGLECTYPPTRDRAAYSRQYVQNLEARVQALEMMQGRLMPMLEVFEKDHPEAATSQRLPLEPAASSETSRSRTNGLSDNNALKLEPGVELGKVDREGGDGEIHMESGEEGNADDVEGEGEVEGSSPTPSPDAGQITQDDRGNYRWIGSSNTLSLLDSLASGHRGSPGLPTPPLHERPATAAGSGAGGGGRSGSASGSTSVTGGAAGSGTSNPYFGPVAGAGVVKALPGVNEVVFPHPERGMEMVDAFFKDVYPILPVVIEQEFRNEYRALMKRRERGEPEKPGGFISVVFAIYALGERVLVTTQAWNRERSKFDDDAGDNQPKPVDFDDDTVQPGEAEAGVIWYERAQILHYTTLKDVNIYQVQCLTLMAAFQAAVNAMPMSWLLAGQAIRVAQDLGLHRSTARTGLSFVDKQLRARCWWAIYGLERLVSVSLGRPLGIEDLDIDAALPVPVEDSALRKLSKDSEVPDEPEQSTMSGFIALTKLCKIAGRVAQLLYRPSNGRSVVDPTWSASQQSTINKLDRLLKDWLEKDVPSKYKDPSSTTSRGVQLLSAILSNAYFTVLLTLHRNFLPSNPAYPRPRPPSNSQSLSQLVEAARSVIHVASQQRVLLPPSHHLSAYCHNLWSSAVVLLLCEVQARDQIVIDAVGSSVESCRRILQALEPAWPGSRKLKELLNDAEIRAKEVSSLGLGGVVAPVHHQHAGKKRKYTPDGGMGMTTSGRHSKRSMGPPQHRQFPSTSSPDPRRAYEMSNTRTMARDDDYFASFPMPPHHQQPYTAPPSQLNFNNAPQNQNPSANPFDTHPGTGTNPTNPILFDVGGVTFDGLEMLQGFTNTEAANFWNSFISPTGQANYVYSGQTTPVSSGPSPGGTGAQAWQAAQLGAAPPQQGHMPAGQGQSQGAQGQGHGQGQGQGQVQGQQVNSSHQQGGVGVSEFGGGGGGGGQMISPVNHPSSSPTGLMGGPGSDFWSQLAPGGGFDWGADPNVPFNI